MHLNSTVSMVLEKEILVDICGSREGDKVDGEMEGLKVDIGDCVGFEVILCVGAFFVMLVGDTLSCNVVRTLGDLGLYLFKKAPQKFTKIIQLNLVH